VFSSEKRGQVLISI